MLPYELSFDEMLFHIKNKNDTYFIGIISETPVQPSETYIRKHLGKLIIRIEARLRSQGIRKIAAIVPEEDLHFYSTFFNMAGIKTYLMCRFPPDDNLTDHFFISETMVEDLKVYEECSVVFDIFDPDTEDGVDAAADELENPNIVLIEARQLDETLIEGGDPLDLYRVVNKQNVKINKNDPYAPFPDYEDRYSKEPLNFMQVMLESMPEEPEVRRVVTSSVENSPPDSVKEEAQSGLDYRSKYGRGGTAVGIARARDLSNGKSVSNDTIRRMVAFFTRHQKNRVPPNKKKMPDGGPTNGWIAWQLWGGDAGQTWALSQMKKIEKESGNETEN